MRDIKKEEEIKNNKQLKYECICDRIYFEDNCGSSMINLKTSYVPLENLLS